MKVLISGAGVAGNALAFWLSKLGHHVTVVERFPSLRTTGLQIDLRGHGVEVMRRMGLEQAFSANKAPEQGLELVDRVGRRRAYFPANKSGKGLQSFTTDFEIMRGDLCRIMYDVAKDRTEFVFGTSIEAMEEKSDRVEVQFTDGRKGSFDLVVGADGQGSRTRKMMLGPGTADAFHPLGGLYTAYFTIPQPIKRGEEYNATSYIATGRRGIMTRRHNPRQMQVYLGGKADSDRLQLVRGDVQKEKEALRELFQGAGWRTEEISEAMMEADDFYLEHMGIVKLDSWSVGRVTLVGDAGYCPSASTGMGTTSALVGAYILAGEISKHCGGSQERSGNNNGLKAALEEYERKFRPFMSQVTRGLAEGTDPWGKMPSTPFGISILYGMASMVSMLRLDILGRFFLREEVKEWELPDYKEMV